MRNTFILCLLFGQALIGQSSLQQVVSTFADHPELANAVISVDVRETGGRRLASYDAELACIPASTLKLITTAVAIDVLGPDHRFRTTLVAGGEPTGGTLNGNLYLVGGGDPTLGSPFMDGVDDLDAVIARWADAVQRAGIRSVRGAVIGDGSYFGTDGVGYAWPFADLGNYYGAGAHGLNIAENSYFLSFTQRSTVGSTPPVYSVDPKIPGLRLTNELRSGPRGSGDQAYIYGAPYNFENFVRGTIPVGSGRFRIRGSIPDPPLLAAQLLTAELERRGIEVLQPAATSRLTGAGGYLGGRLLDERYSPPLSEIVARTNLRSNNLYAEILLREINKARGKENHELSSTEVITDWLGERGLPVAGVHLQDGSGLGTRNYFSASFMVDFLLAGPRVGRASWIESIPVAGRSGSLRSRLKNSAAAGRLRAKSGSIQGARAYAGYVDRVDGSKLAFSIMVNNYTMKGDDLNRLMLDLMAEFVTAAY